jgi:hypothetical protein
MPARQVEAHRALRAHILHLLAQLDGPTRLLAELDELCLQDHDAVYEALALIDQHYRLGRINEQNYRRLKSHASDIALGRGRPRQVPVPVQVPEPVPVQVPVQVPEPSLSAPLSELLAALPGRRLPLALTLAVVRDIGHSLASLHAQRLNHAGIGIGQIVITASGTAELCNAGAAADGQDADLGEDLVSLAALAYELLTGVHPFQGLNAADARQLGLRPRRPPGLKRQQWQVLEQELVGAVRRRAVEPLTWVRRLVRGSAARRLPAPADFRSIPAGRRWSWRGIRNWR